MQQETTIFFYGPITVLTIFNKCSFSMGKRFKCLVQRKIYVGQHVLGNTKNVKKDYA